MYDVLSSNNGLARCELICFAPLQVEPEPELEKRKATHTEGSNRVRSRARVSSNPWTILRNACSHLGSLPRRLDCAVFWAWALASTVADLSMTNLQNRFSLPMPMPVNLACWHFSAWCDGRQPDRHGKKVCIVPHFFSLTACVSWLAYFPAGIPRASWMKAKASLAKAHAADSTTNSHADKRKLPLKQLNWLLQLRWYASRAYFVLPNRLIDSWLSRVYFLREGSGEESPTAKPVCYSCFRVDHSA